MRFDVITIGSALEDITFYTSECRLINNKGDLLCKKMLAFEYGAKIGVDKINKSFGGGAANTAVSFSNLGLKTSIVSSIGNDERGDKIKKNFRDKGVNLRLMQVHKDKETGYSFILASTIHDNEHIVFSNRGTNNLLQLNTKIVSLLNKKTDWIYVTSLCGKWRDNLNAIFSCDKPNIAWNIGSAQLKSGARFLSKYLKRTKVLILNKDEALELALSDLKNKNKPNKTLNNSRYLIRLLWDMGPELVVITNGRRGAYAYDGLKFYAQGIHKNRRRVDTTGVGDAYGSGFIAGLIIHNFDIEKSLVLASKNAAGVVAEVGAQNGLLGL